MYFNIAKLHIVSLLHSLAYCFRVKLQRNCVFCPKVTFEVHSLSLVLIMHAGYSSYTTAFWKPT